MKLQLLIPLHTYGEGNDDRIAVHAATFASHLNADVHALVLAAEFPKVSSPLGSMIIDVPAMAAEAKASCRTRGGALVKALASEMEPVGITIRTSEAECLPELFGDLVADHSRYHDLTLIGIGVDPATQETAKAAIFSSGRPTILVPETAAVPSPDHVMIAWDGTGVAARAVADSRDFLRKAQTVTIVTVIDEKPLPVTRLGERLAEYLAFHDIKAHVVQVHGAGRAITDSLQTRALDSGAGLLVMGGFGHSRMRDFVLGGATSGILQSLQVPVLLSH